MSFLKSHNNFSLWVLIFCLLMTAGHIPSYSIDPSEKELDTKTKKTDSSDKKEKHFEQQSISQSISIAFVDVQIYFLDFQFELRAPLRLSFFSGSHLFLVSQTYKDILYEHIVSPNAP